MKVTLIRKEQVAKSAWAFYFQPERPVRYIAGQYIELFMSRDDHDKRGRRRFFTLSSSPTENLLLITTKIRPNSGSTFKRELVNSELDTKFDMLPPMGDFVLPKDANIPLVFVAMGMGITPFRSILKYLTDTKSGRKIILIYKESSQKEIVYEKLLQTSPAELIKIIDQSLKSKEILEIASKFKDPIYFLAGPEKLIENLQNELLSAGIKQENLRADFFHNY